MSVIPGVTCCHLVQRLSVSYTFGKQIFRSMTLSLYGVSPGAVRIVYSDASDTGFGGYIVEHGQYVAHSHWDAVEAQQS